MLLSFILQLLIGSINYIVSLVFHAVKDTFIGSVFATGYMVVELAENQINPNFII